MRLILQLYVLLASAAVTFVMGGCASGHPRSATANTDFMSRSVARSDGMVQVSTSVLSAAESLAVYAVPLAKRGIQPVWIQVENRDDVTYWFMSPGLDPNFFAASEVADAFASGDRRDGIDRRSRELAFRNPIPAGATVSGFVLTNLDEGAKLVEVDLVTSGDVKTFSSFHVVPGFRADYKAREAYLRDRYTDAEIIDYESDSAFRAALESLPCCVTNKKGNRNGDPLNLVVIGGREDAFPALVRRGWRLTEETWIGSVMKMAISALSGERYPYAPISPLYLYGRPQDLAWQKARDSIHQRNHLRLWLSPLRYRGKSVWVGQISRDIGTRPTIHSPYLMTHKIDPDVDEGRTALMQDLVYSQNPTRVGLVKGVEAATKSTPRMNLTTDPYYTDGLRAVLIFDEDPVSLEEVDFLRWERFAPASPSRGDTGAR